jgi:hypothetical protein
MHERRVTLLRFAIAASVAVVPVLLLVLFGMRPFAPTETRSNGSHVSVRQLAALRTFEHAVVRRDAVSDGLPDGTALAAMVPACQEEWSGRERLVDRLLLSVGVTNTRPTPGDRLANHLKDLDRALARMSGAGNRRVQDPVGFDALRWTKAAQRVLASPVETPQYPGRSFRVLCADLAAAARTLSRGDGRMLETLAWRGSEVGRAIVGWRPDQHVAIGERLLARGNPWSGLPGCVYLYEQGRATPTYFVRRARAASERICTHPALFDVGGNGSGAVAPGGIPGEPGLDTRADDLRWQIPPALHALLRPLEPLQRTNGALYRAFTAEGPPNRIALHGADVDVGFSVDLTIDPLTQAIAQKTAACYTGRQDLCEGLRIRRAEDFDRPIGHRLLESAVVRVAAIAIVDVASGRIEALAGSMSPCARQEHDGPGRASECDRRVPYPIRYRPDALLNPAVYLDAMPASLVKPVMASAFLSNATVGPRLLAGERDAMRTTSPPAAHSLRWQLMRSDSARFLDRMFCADRGFSACTIPWEIQARADAFGWNRGCASPGELCGANDLLFGRPVAAQGSSGDVEAPASWVSFGRLMVEPARGSVASAPFQRRAPVALDASKIRRCAYGADGVRGNGDDWEKCRGGMIVDVVAEGWGQGHARSTALGAAGMMATLAAAANGQSEVRKPHLIRAVRGVASAAPGPVDSAAARWAAASIERNGIPSDIADVILSGLSYSHRLGTARRACEQVFDARTCRDIDWIAGKTGTPTFPNDERSLDELHSLCAPAARRTKAEESACGALRPYKWYVAAWRSDPASPAWSKVIGVLTERNWLADSGRIHGAGDHGPNPAAEIAFQVLGRRMGLIVEDIR